MYWMFLPLKRYADFSGRSPRIEYWMFALFQWLVLIGLVVLGFMMFDARSSEPDPAIAFPLMLAGLAWLVFLIPSIAVTVRRLHDRNQSGWLYLLVFVPYIGPLVLFVFTVLPGDEFENQYGPNPFDDPDSGTDRLEQVFT